MQLSLSENSRSAPRVISGRPGWDTRGISLEAVTSDSYCWILSRDDITTKPVMRAAGGRPTCGGAKPTRESILLTNGDCSRVLTGFYRPNDDPIGKAVEFIHRNIGSTITLKCLSEVACLPKQTFARRFVEKIGIDPRSFVNRCRVEHASILLRRKKKRSLKEIAVSSGFGDVRNLRIVFRRLMGSTPTAYRRNRSLRANAITLPRKNLECATSTSTCT
jgi:AraC-like DNA-binding protein